jgi:hypothetical protein
VLGVGDPCVMPLSTIEPSSCSSIRKPELNGTTTGVPPAKVGSGAPSDVNRVNRSLVVVPSCDCASVTIVPPEPIATLKPLVETGVGIVAMPPEPKPWSTAPAGVSR